MRESAKKITRRHFIKMASGGLAAGGVVYLTGCVAAPIPTTQETGATAPTPTSEPSTAAPVAAVVRTMRIASSESGGADETMDPAFSAQDTDASRISMVYQRLVHPDSGYVPQPQLAESWEPNENGDVWTFNLRKGVKFHDGRDFTAKDVVYTYQRLLNPETGSAATASLSVLTSDGIEMVDDYTVRFTLADPFADLPLALANRFTYIVPEGSTSEELRLNSIGTGPFKQSEFTPGSGRSLFVKNENYWEPGLPKVDEIELRSITEGTARNAALLANQIDIAMEIDPAGYTQMAASPDIKIVQTKTPYVVNMAVWCDTPPFDDVRVRTAMKLVMDRDTIVKTVLLGLGNVGNDHPVAPWVEYAWDVEPKKQDIERAKQLLAEAGQSNLQVELFTAEAAPGMVLLAQVYKEMAALAGIEVTINQTPSDTYWSEIWMKKPFTCSAWSGRPADEALTTPYLSTAEWNETHWYRPEFDELIFEARKTVDYDKRTQLYQDAQKLLAEDGGTLIPMFLDAISATRANVAGWDPHPTKYVKDFRLVEFTS